MGLPVNALMAVPVKIMPPPGAVKLLTILSAFGVPPNCTLVVGGLMLVWAIAVSVANAKRRKHSRTRAVVRGPQHAALTAAVVRVEGFIFYAFPVMELNSMNFSPNR